MTTRRSIETHPASADRTTAREYSKRLGTLTHEQLQAALDRFDLGRLVHAEPVPFGLFGQNVFLTSTTGEYVLRGAPFGPWQLPKERFFTRLLHERTSVPVPWPYLHEPGDDLFGWSYVIMPRMPGIQLANREVREALSAADRQGIAAAMGMTLADLHTLTWPHTGEYDAGTDTIQPLDAAYDAWIVSRIHHYVQLAVSHSDRTTEADLAWVEELIAQGGEALAVPFRPRFVMQDYKEGNAVAERREGGWRVSGVFDLMEAHFGDGEVDLCRQAAIYADVDPELARTFVAAYRARLRARGETLRPGCAGRFPVYMLLDRAIIWEYGQRCGVWFDAELTLRQYAEPYTSLEVLPPLGCC